jgi:uncharacterized membrane protein
MSAHAFIIALCILTVLAHVSLMFCRGWLIGECRREQNKMKTAWEDFKQEQEKWRKDFENEHKAPWQRSTSRRTA